MKKFAFICMALTMDLSMPTERVMTASRLPVKPLCYPEMRVLMSCTRGKPAPCFITVMYSPTCMS